MAQQCVSTSLTRCTTTTRLTIPQECYTIEHLINANTDIGDADTQVMDRDIILKMDDPAAGYDFNVNDFYLNVAACKNGNLDATFLFDGQALPPCFDPIHFLRADSTVCSVDQSTVPEEVLDDLLITTKGGCPVDDPCGASGCVPPCR